MRLKPKHVVSIASIIGLMTVSNLAPATSRGLLVGIGNYSGVPSLEGPPYDLVALQELLPKWGFAKKNLTVLKDQQVTRAGFLQALG